MHGIIVTLEDEVASTSEAPETFEDVAFEARLPDGSTVRGNAYDIEVFGTMTIAWWTRDDVPLTHPHIERAVRQRVIASIDAWFATKEAAQ